MQFLDKIHNFDCLELLKHIPDGSIDLVVSSPPYNLGKDYENRKLRDLRMFPKIVEGPRENEKVMFTAKYKPDQFSSAYIAYLDRGYSDIITKEKVIKRSVSIYEGVGCYYRSIQKELN